ncbi:MAG: hypothetical protein ACD_3C00164G0003 [uncultured bacterium (gcode 4)]|uniref:ATPase AAA-type core domain-containing protein n=1 Tax=uncultured bacterium (gcode 4) TaxID=1234023 RepID=K2F9E7_9BACT|nr:MAG: hypothetical protein ACD_3C00164G0003 [uncultured bacterium (gcode 4)]
MRIKKLKVSNFRNLKEIDVKFENINIITWKNSSWKTNLTQLLANCVYTENDIEKVFWNNILTLLKWIWQTNIEVIIGNLEPNWFWLHDDNMLSLHEAIEYVYKFEILKNPISIKKRSIDFYWRILEETLFKEDFESKIKDLIKIHSKKPIELKKKVFEETFKQSESENILNNLLDIKKDGREHLYKKNFIEATKDKIIYYDDKNSFSNCAWNIFDFVTWIKEVNKKEMSLQAVEEVNKKEINQGVSNFSTAKFIFLLADIQRDESQLNRFYKDLDDYTDGILRKVYINMEWKDGSKWDIYVDSPHWPRNIEFISAWTAIILYFVLLKNWLSLKNKSYQNPDIMIFDELDSVIHPSLMSNFSELLKIISGNVQLFISTHSPIFINKFNRENVYLLKDIWSFSEKVKVKSNILSYEFILSKLNKEERTVYDKLSNSELYVDWLIDNLFPTNY